MKKWRPAALLLIPSALLFAVLQSTRNKLSLCMLAALGLAAGICFARRAFSFEGRRHWAQKGVAAALSLLWAYASVRSFYGDWKDSSIFGKLLEKLPFDSGTGAAVVCCALAVGALPAIAFTVLRGTDIAIGLFRSFDFRGAAAGIGKALKRAAKPALLCVLCVALAAGVGTGLLTAVYSMDTEPIDRNVRASAARLSGEGAYPGVFSWCYSTLDNYTDALILMEAAYESEESPLVQAMKVQSGGIETPEGEEKNQHQIFVMHYRDDMPYTLSFSYARYWHGNLALVKPLLSLLTYSQLRLVNLVAQAVLFLCVCVLLALRGYKRYIPAWGVVYLVLMPVVLGLSLQYSACYYLMTIGALVILGKREVRPTNCYLLFLFLGIATAYFDFLTYPALTFGVPMIFCALRLGDRSPEEKLLSILSNGVSWVFGFGAMWASKWVLSDILTDENTIADALQNVMHRTSATENAGSFTFFDAFRNNLSLFVATPFILLGCLLIIRAARNLDRAGGMRRAVYRRLLPYVLIGMVPFAWYAIVLNHSWVHSFFTHKLCAVTLLALLVGLIDAATPRPSEGITNP